jgi:hypothetical protein
LSLTTGDWITYVVAGFLVFIPLLVGLGLFLIRTSLLLVQSLPALTKELANLA